MRIRKYGVIFLILMLIGCNEEKVGNRVTIFGEWKAYKKTTISGDSVNFLGNQFKSNMHFELFSKGLATNLNDPVSDFNYSQFDDTLKFGNRLYIIKSLENDTLLLKEYDPSFPDDSRAYVHHLKRQSND